MKIQLILKKKERIQILKYTNVLSSQTKITNFFLKKKIGVENFIELN